MDIIEQYKYMVNNNITIFGGIKDILLDGGIIFEEGGYVYFDLYKLYDVILIGRFYNKDFIDRLEYEYLKIIQLVSNNLVSFKVEDTNNEITEICDHIIYQHDYKNNFGILLPYEFFKIDDDNKITGTNISIGIYSKFYRKTLYVSGIIKIHSNMELEEFKMTRKYNL